MHSRTVETQEFAFTLNKHRKHLLRVPGCVGIALGKKEVGGEITEDLALVIFVDKKLAHPHPHAAPPTHIDGLPVDVVERRFSFRPISAWDYLFGQQIDPHARHDPLLCGIAIAPADREFCYAYGSLGCFIRTTGKAAAPGHPQILPGVYLLTNRHVLSQAFMQNNAHVIQPGFLAPNPVAPVDPPQNSVIGTYVDGYQDAQNDCAIVALNATRQWANQVDCAPGVPGRKNLTGIAQAQVGDEVYKFGATTKYTTGIVRYTHFPTGGYQDTIYVENTAYYQARVNQLANPLDQTKIWVAQGDSGSVLIRKQDDQVVGLNFRSDSQTDMAGVQVQAFGQGWTTSYGGLAFDMQGQINNFGGHVTLA